MRLTICSENLLLLHPLIARLSTETAAFVSFRLLRLQRVCFWMHSDVNFCFSSLSFSPLSPVTAFHSLTSASFAIVLRFSRILRLLVAVVSCLVIWLFRRQPLILSLQLVVDIVGLPLVNFSFSYPMSTHCHPKSPAGEL